MQCVQGDRATFSVCLMCEHVTPSPCRRRRMNTYIERTCTEVGDENEREVSLADFRGRDAYVLLGGPGGGKTRSFEEEWQRTEDGLYVKAHDFVDLSRPNEWRGKTLFIDGLDELRASSPSPEPLGLIRAKLDKLGRPRFRLSCRDANWSSALDADDLAKVSRDGRVAKLKLAPLSDSEVGKFLAALNVDEAAFADRARDAPSPRDPLILEHLVRAVKGGQQPRSRKEVFEASCRYFLREHNPRHARSRENEPFGVEEQLDAAAQLCAVALLSGKRGYVRSPAESDAHWITIGEVPGNQDLFNAVLRTRLFEVADDRFAPPHHHIAEFLAGRHLAKRVLAKRVEDRLPHSRAVALMTGFDGGVVAALRGVWAWFAAHCAVARAELIDRDPLGTVLFGDVKQFPTIDTKRLLDRLRHSSEELDDLPIDHWYSPRWADVAAEGPTDLIWDVFSKAPNSKGGQCIAQLLVSAAEHWKFPDLRQLLLSIVRNDRLRAGTRTTALRSLISRFGCSPKPDNDLDSLLREIGARQLADHGDDLTGLLLCELYPHRVSLADAKSFLHTPKRPDFIGSYQIFWTNVVQERAHQSDRDEALSLAMKFNRLAQRTFSGGDDACTRVTP